MPQKKIDEILDTYDRKVNAVSPSEHYHQKLAQALADLLLGLPSLQDEENKMEHPESKPGNENYFWSTVGRNELRKQLRQEIAEALGVKEASGEAGN